MPRKTKAQIKREQAQEQCTDIRLYIHISQNQHNLHADQHKQNDIDHDQPYITDFHQSFIVVRDIQTHRKHRQTIH